VNDHRTTQWMHGKMVRFFKVVAMIVMLSLMAQPALASEGNPRVAPPNSKPYGKTYNQWTAEWWKYVMGIPASTNPLADANGAHCGDGQSGPVFFLVGTTGGPAVRNDCVVPVGKSILFPIINVISAVPEDGRTADEIRSLATWYESHVDDVRATVDGVDLQNLLSDYRFPSPIFAFDGASPGIFNPSYEGHRDIAFSDGWWVMLKPLTPGPHKIHFYGHQSVPEWGLVFSIDVTYNLTVGKRRP